MSVLLVEETDTDLRQVTYLSAPIMYGGLDTCLQTQPGSVVVSVLHLKQHLHLLHVHVECLRRWSGGFDRVLGFKWVICRQTHRNSFQTLLHSYMYMFTVLSLINSIGPMRPGLVSIGITKCHVRGLPGSYSIDHTDTVSSSGEQINYYILYSASGEY